MDRRLLFVILGGIAIAGLVQLGSSWPLGHSPQSRRFAMSILARDLAGQPHACVPLGWDPASAGESYYPSYSAEYREDGVWLHPYWLGLVQKSQLAEVDARAAYNVMNALVRAGLLQRADMQDAFLYRMTAKAEPYYYEDNMFGNNPEHFPYLCYSYDVPERIVAIQHINERIFNVGFDVRETRGAAWADDPFLRRHSVILAPRVHTLTANFSDAGGWWHIKKIVARYGMLPYAVDPEIWPKPRF